ncbi:hypothetical protein SK128_007966 [Halocaridina rubra]|uniref:Uncharacterized protein n=1 Tax=Halocaridina rubra TaxID=373956 RepID=A0AAN8WLK3_HALRR
MRAEEVALSMEEQAIECPSVTNAGYHPYKNASWIFPPMALDWLREGHQEFRD